MKDRNQSNGNYDNGSLRYKPDDLESAISSTRRKPRFRDIVNLAVESNLHGELKRKLKDGIDREALEKYRKSVEEIKQMKNKKTRGFYEEQNERLNDWLEVDTLVMHMADDVLDSMNPQDLDGDGIAELGGALKNTGGDIEPLLPKDERENRRKGERNAKWAINVPLAPYPECLNADGYVDQRHSQYPAPNSQMYCRFQFFVAFTHRFARRLRSGSTLYIDHLDNAQAGAMEDSQITTQVPCWSSET